MDSTRNFHNALLKVFDHPTMGCQPGDRLLDCRQGNQSAAEFSLEFHTIAAGLRWTEKTLMTIFWWGLNQDLQDEFAFCGDAMTF